MVLEVSGMGYLDLDCLHWVHMNTTVSLQDKRGIPRKPLNLFS